MGLGAQGPHVRVHADELQHGPRAPLLHAHDEGLGQPFGAHPGRARVVDSWEASGWRGSDGRAGSAGRAGRGPRGIAGAGLREKFLAARAGAAQAGRRAEEAALAQVVAAAQEAVAQVSAGEREREGEEQPARPPRLSWPRAAQDPIGHGSMGPRRGSWFPGGAGGGAAVALRPPRGLARRCPGPAGRAWGAPSSPGAAGRGAHHARGSRGRRLLGAQAAARPTSPRPGPRGSGRRSSGLTCAGFGARPAPEAPLLVPGAPRPERSAAARPRGLAGGTDGGAGAGPARAPREMPSRARCRLYLRSRLTSAARVPRARAPPWDLARPLRPHSPAPPRDALSLALPAQAPP